ncbi:hypothetical protein D3C73_1099870 [compost metagenome]
MQEVALVALGLDHGPFKAPVELTSGVTEGQRLQPGQAVVNAVWVVLVADAIFGTIELIAGGQRVAHQIEFVRCLGEVLIHITFGLTKSGLQHQVVFKIVLGTQ